MPIKPVPLRSTCFRRTSPCRRTRARKALIALILGVAGALAGSLPNPAALAANPTQADARPAARVTAPADTAITVESDRMQYDDRQRINVFRGNVVLVRGEMEIRADELVLRQNAKGEQTAVATGSPATFVQRRGGDLAEGSGREMRFNNATRELLITGGATLSRQRPGQAPDSVSGARIVYQSASDFFTVDSGSPGTNADSPRSRVRVIIQPRSDAPAAEQPR